MTAILAHYAKLYGRSESTIRRWRDLNYPLDDRKKMRDIMDDLNSRRGVSKFSRKLPVDVQSEPEPKPECDPILKDLVSIYVALFNLCRNDDSLRAKLWPVIEIILPRIAVEAED